MEMNETEAEKDSLVEKVGLSCNYSGMLHWDNSHARICIKWLAKDICNMLVLLLLPGLTYAQTPSQTPTTRTKWDLG